IVSGFLISPNDQLRILSGLAMPILISSNVSGLAIGFAKGVSSFIFSLPHSPPAAREGQGGCIRRLFGRERWRFLVALDAVQFDVQTEAAHLLDEHVEALRDAGLEGVVALDDRLVDL